MSEAAPQPSRVRAILAAFGKPSAATMFFLGFGSGLPFLLVGGTVSTWLRDAGLKLSVIGLISYAGFFYTLKFLWSPLLDRFTAPITGRLGRRRGWLVLSQLVIAVSLGLMGLVGPSPQSQAMFVALIALTALGGSTQDTVVDAYRIEIAPVEQQGALAATYTLGYRLALLASGAGALYLAEYWSWRGAYGVMAALMLVPLGATLLAREPEVAVVHARSLAQTFTGPFLEFFRRNGLWLALGLLAFVGLYQLPDQVLGVIANPFYRDTGFSKAEIATVSKIFGVWVGIAGAFLGGAVVSAWGVKKPLIPAAIAVAASNLLFITMSVFPGERWAFVLTIAGDNLSQGFGGTVLVAFMSSLASARYTATQYALMSSLANLPGRFIGGLSGFVVESTSYTTFFVFSTFSVLPTLLVLAWLWGRLEEAAPPEAAAAPGRST
jgi:PAT family beta-lactamase induction signal transducer AmpG